MLAIILIIYYESNDNDANEKYDKLTHKHNALNKKYEKAMLIIHRLKNSKQNTYIKIEKKYEQCKSRIDSLTETETEIEIEVEIILEPVENEKEEKNSCPNPSFIMMYEKGMINIDKTYKNLGEKLFSENRNGRGDINSKNWYLAPQSHPIISYLSYKGLLLYNLNNLSEQPTQLNSNDYAVECFFIQDYEAICCGAAKLIK